MSCLKGVVGFLICVAGVLSIKVTSPVTHMFSAAVRSVLQTILGIRIFGDVINTYVLPHRART
jgi:GDP-fucose transporter C1